MTASAASRAPGPAIIRRVAAIASILLVVAALGSSLAVAIRSPLRLPVVVVAIAIFALAVWYSVSRAGGRRAVAVAFAVAAVAAVLAVAVAGSPISLLTRILLLVVAVVLGRYALSRDMRTLKASSTSGTPVPAATRGTLIMNLKSGGGKAERFDLVGECGRRGIQPIVLQPGDDLVDLAGRAIDAGADVIGMAGGDGSQALVASVAAERGIPMVVVPAGTRNHLALDLGIDRNDVVGALDAYASAVERPIDLAEVNGRVFVNNVSLGLYAKIVQSPEYRDAKAETTLAALPKVLGPGTAPFDLRFDGADGVHHDGAHVIQVSNGSYGQTLRTIGSRATISEGKLGVVVLVIPDDGSATRFLQALATGNPSRYEGYQAWAAETFTVDSGEPVAIGLDGETLVLEPPLEFRVRPGVLRIRLSHGAIGHSPTARKLALREALPALWQVARGRTVAIGNSGVADGRPAPEGGTPDGPAGTH